MHDLSPLPQSTPADEKVAGYIAEMRQALRAAPEIYRPGEFWDRLIESNLEMLQSSGVANFKRTVSNNYYNWLVTSLHDPQIRRAIVNWLRAPTLAPFRNRLEEPMSGLRTTDRGAAYEFSGHTAWRYRVFVGMLWEFAARNDPDGLTQRLSEPETGNPVRIRHDGRLISQDLANSIIEFTFASRSGVVEDGARVAELGAGYGRLAYIHMQARRLVYCIFDIPPTLAVAQWYLTEVLGVDRVRPFDSGLDFASVEPDLVPGTVAFFTPDQLAMFPDGWFDLTQTISTLPEMPAEQADHYLALLTDKARAAFFLKQWRSWRNPADHNDLREGHYRPPPGWYTHLRRVDPVQPAFFDQLWCRDGPTEVAP